MAIKRPVLHPPQVQVPGIVRHKTYPAIPTLPARGNRAKTAFDVAAMKRSNSMENAVNILPDMAPPPPLPQQPVPGPARSISSSEFLSPPCSSRGPRSASSSSLISPRSAISEDFRFLNVDSPGIQLVSNSPNIFYLPTEVWSEDGIMDPVVISSNNHSDMVKNENLPVDSIESVDQESISSAGCSRTDHHMLLESISHPDLTSNNFEVGGKSHVSHQRSLSAGAISSMENNELIISENPSSTNDNIFDGDIDEGVGSTSESPDVMESMMSSLPRDSLAYKLMSEAGLTSIENTKDSNDDDSSEHEREYDDQDSNNGTDVTMDRVFESMDRSVNGRSVVSNDLPSISEENEDFNTLSRTSARNRRPPLSQLENLHVSEESIPEPEELAPGTAYTTSLNNLEYVYDNSGICSPTVGPIPIHRRVVSDNYCDYALHPAMELDDMNSSNDFTDEQDQEPRIRSRVGRGCLMNNRCQSQMIFQNENHGEKKEHRLLMTDRSLSNSDPTLNVDKEDVSDSHGTPSEATSLKPQPASSPARTMCSSNAPPPVVLTRKNSTVQPNSWKGLFSHQGAIPHNVVTPATANLMNRSRTSSRSQTQVVGDSSITAADSACSSPSPSISSTTTVSTSSSASPFARDVPSLRRSTSSSNIGFVRRSIRRLISGSSKDEDVYPNSVIPALGLDGERSGSLRRRTTGPHKKPSRLKARSRVEKPKKSGSDTFSFGNFFSTGKAGKRGKKERQSLDEVIKGYEKYEGSLSHSGRSMPILRRPQDRPTIIQETLDVPEGTVVGEDECYVTTGFIDSIVDPKSSIDMDNHSYSSSTSRPPSTSSYSSLRSNYYLNHFRLHSNQSNPSSSPHEQPPASANGHTHHAYFSHVYDEFARNQRSCSFPRRRVSALLFNSLGKTFKLKKGSLTDGVAGHILRRLRGESDSESDADDEDTIEEDDDDLPDKFQRVFSPTHTNDEDVAVFEKTDFVTSLHENPKWNRLSLFSVSDYGSWREKYRHDTLSSKAVSKQDAIYELIMIEKQHCENLVFLQQGYRARLLDEHILTEAEVNVLIPDVMDALLVFHCHLLEQLMVRQNEKDEVDSISDIIGRDFSEDGKHTPICINAYTTFGTMKDHSERMYTQLLQKNSKFAEFMKLMYQEKIYRKYEFKPMMTKVIGRPAKYGLLMDNIAKFEGGKLTPAGILTEEASKATKRFAGRIDNNLLIAQMAKKWEEIKHYLDHTSHTVLYFTDSNIESDAIRLVFNFDDVCYGVGEGGRRLICLGEVNWKVTGLSQKHVFLVLFDDILVVLTKKNGRYVFAAEQSVLPVSSLMLRVGGRGQSAMILSKSLKPILFELEFGSKSDMAKWVKSLETTIHAQSVKVRLSPRSQEELAQQLVYYQDVKEKQYKIEENEWNKKLEIMFAERNQKDDVLSEYFTDRAQFYEDLRIHMTTFPCRGRTEVGDRVREAVRTKLRELRTSRSVAFSKLLDDTDRAREVELWSYFNDRADLGEASLGDSDGSGSDSSASGRKPRRIKTFSGAPSSANTKANLRRHTTVPRMSTSDGCEAAEGEETAMNSQEEKEEEQIVEQQVHRLSLRQPLASRRECGELIRDVEKLKKENIKLRNDAALDKLRIATLERTRGAIVADSLSVHGDTMEALRNKEKEVREEDARKRREFENWEAHLVEFKQTLDNERAQFDGDRSRSEKELQLKWEAFRAAERRRTAEEPVDPNRISMNNTPTPTRTTFIENRTSTTSSQVIPLNLSESKKRHK